MAGDNSTYTINAAGQCLYTREEQIEAWKAAISEREVLVATARTRLAVLEEELEFCRQRLFETQEGITP